MNNIFRGNAGLRAMLLVAAAATAIAAARWPASTVHATPLHTFTNQADGGTSGAGVIVSASGVLYGTASSGGTNGLGTVFSLTPPVTGKIWAQATLWAFTGGADGAMPEGALIADSTGALYGTTTGGGTGVAGTVFKLTPPGSGQTAWTETTLYSFMHGTDGGAPTVGLIADASGALYGTTGSYGAGFGTVFKLTPPAKGQTAWTETTLLSFDGGANGGVPLGSLLIDSAGNLYGTASHGGTNAVDGIVFELSPSGGSYTETVLWNFTGADGAHPASALIADTAGDLYGTTAFGGAYAGGTVFELSPPAVSGGAWTRTTLWNFSPTQGGLYPFGSLLADKTGALYGATFGYSPEDLYSVPATIYRLTPPPQGSSQWTGTTLAVMTNNTGLNVLSALATDIRGRLYGTASLKGNPRGYGTVFTVTGTGFKAR